MKKRPISMTVSSTSKPSCRTTSVWMYCLHDVGGDANSTDDVTGVRREARNGDADMSGKRRGFTGNVDHTLNGDGANHKACHRSRNFINTRANCSRAAAGSRRDAFPSRATKQTPVSTSNISAFLRVDGVTMRPESGGIGSRANSTRCRCDQRRTKSAKAEVLVPATSRSLNIYNRSLSLTPEIYSLMHSPRDTPSPCVSKSWRDRCVPDTWSPNMSVPPPELTSNEWVKVLRANPGDPILQRAPMNCNTRYRQKTCSKHRPVSAGFCETTRDSARHAGRHVSDAFQDLRLADGYDIPRLTRCRRPKTAGPSLWRASDFVGVAEPKSALTPATQGSCPSTISVTKSAFTPRIETPRSNRSTISVTLPSTRDSCWVESPHHVHEPLHAQLAYPPKTPYNSPKGSLIDLSCRDSDEDTL